MAWKEPINNTDEEKTLKIKSSLTVKLFRATLKTLLFFIEFLLVIFLFFILLQIFFIDQLLRIKGEVPGAIFGFSWNDFVSLPILNTLFGNTHNYISILYESINTIFNGLAAEIIFLTPFIILCVFSTTDLKIKIKTKLIDGLISFWAIALFVYGLIYLIVSKNSFIEFIIVIAPLLWLSTLVTDVSQEGRYSLLLHGRNLKNLNSFRLKNKNYDNSFMRVIFSCLLIFLFWFNTVVVSTYISQINILSISSCLFVIGFLALIFTYAHSSLTSESIRLKIQEDIEAVYRVVGVTIMASLFCMLAFSNIDLNFSLENGFSKTAFMLSFFLLSCAGTVLSIEATINIFKEIAVSLPTKSTANKKMRILFDESYNQDRGINDDGPFGSSGLRDYLVDKGYDVRNITNSRTGPIMTYSPNVMILREISSEISDDRVDKYIELVASGLSFVIFFNSNDILHKKRLFSKIGITLEDFIKLKNCQSAYVYHNADSKKIKNNKSQYLLHLDNAIALNNEEEIPSLFSIYVTDNISNESDRMSISFEYNIGKGSILFIGDIHPWSNRSLKEHDSIDFLDEIFNILESKTKNELQTEVESNDYNKENILAEN